MECPCPDRPRSFYSGSSPLLLGGLTLNEGAECEVSLNTRRDSCEDVPPGVSRKENRYLSSVIKLVVAR